MIDLYEQVVSLTEPYLGPAAERFVARQIQSHLGKTPDQLQVEDISRLAEWSKVAIGLLTSDTQVVDDYTSKLLQLGAQ
jgi:hypothetical protein